MRRNNQLAAITVIAPKVTGPRAVTGDLPCCDGRVASFHTGRTRRTATHPKLLAFSQIARQKAFISPGTTKSNIYCFRSSALRAKSAL
jgi:hypothetical protein